LNKGRAQKIKVMVKFILKVVVATVVASGMLVAGVFVIEVLGI